MNSSMITAAASMNGLQQKLDLIADNIANVNTVGYKSKDSTFEDLLTSLKKQPDEFKQDGRVSPLGGYNQGFGSRFVLRGLDMTQGAFKQTDVPTDLAVEGNALFEVQTGPNDRAFTRSGAFKLTQMVNGDTILATKDGFPVISIGNNAAGRPVEGPIVVPDGQSLKIDSEGIIMAVDSAGATTQLGRLKLVEAVRPERLSNTADNLYTIAADVNRNDVVRDIQPSTTDGITVNQGFLEQSNVDLTKEMTDLMNVQRAYQLMARAISSSDTMQSLANNMRG